jgi:hypothetical protein
MIRMRRTITVVGSRQAIRPFVRCVPSTVVQRNVVNVNASAVADAEAMNWVILDVYVMN